jgi:hypothetical protein
MGSEGQNVTQLVVFNGRNLENPVSYSLYPKNKMKSFICYR